MVTICAPNYAKAFERTYTKTCTTICEVLLSIYQPSFLNVELTQEEILGFYCQVEYLSFNHKIRL